MPTLPNAPADSAAFLPRGEGNPLLGALKQVLQSAIAEQVAGLEERLVQRLETKLAASRTTVAEAVRTEVRALEERLAAQRSPEPRAEQSPAVEPPADERAIVWGIVHLGERLDRLQSRLDSLFDELRRSRKRWFS